MSDDPLWVAYEPQPPNCFALLVTETNYERVAAYFFEPEQMYSMGLLAVARHADGRTGEKSLVLTFQDDKQMPYELTLKMWEALVRPGEPGAVYEVVDYRKFRNEWRERLST